MAKRLIGINSKTGQLSSFNGASWSTIGGSYPSNTGVTSAKAVFTFRSKLYIFTVNTSTQDFEIYEVNLSGPTYTLIANSDIATYASFNLSTVSGIVNYKDAIYIMTWIGTNGNVTGITIAFDGSTITQIPVTVFSNVGASSMAPTGGTYNLPASFYSNALLPCGDKLLCGPKHCMTLGPTFGQVIPISSDRLFTVDFSSQSANIGLLSQIGNPSGINQHDAMNGNSPLNLSMSYNFVVNSIVGFGSYKNKPYVMCMDGRLHELDQGGSKTLKLDIRDNNPERVSYGVTNGTPAGTATLKFSPTTTGLQYNLGPMLIGSKVLITSGAQSGTMGLIINGGGQGTTIESFFASTLDGVSAIPTVEAGTTFTVYKGVSPSTGQTSYSSPNMSAASAGNYTTCIMQEMNGCLYIMIAGRSLLSTSVVDNTVNPSQIIKWDGVTATCYSLKFAGRWLNCWGCNHYYDQTVNLWHIFFYDTTSDLVNHIAWDGNSDSMRLFASPFNLSATNDVGQSDGMVCGFNDTERSVDITGTSFNFSQQKLTINVTCYSPDSASFNASVHYNNLNEWTLATLYQVDGQSPGVNISNPGVALSLTSSPAGVSHTIVHDVASDLPTYDGPIQYQIVGLFS